MNDYITTKRRMGKDAWYEIDGQNYLFHIIALASLFVLTTLGN